MALNLYQAELLLQQKIQTTTDPNELLALFQAVKAMKSGTLITVATVDDLPSLTEAVGKLYYVDAEQAVYFSYKGQKWAILGDDYYLRKLWTWGSNGFGQLGDNTTTNRSSPITTAGGGSDWSQVSGGGGYTAAIKTDGTLWTWGYNNIGQLGDNTVTSRRSPITTAGGGTDWSQVSGGGYYTGAIKTDGTLWTWGRNDYGQLGDNMSTNRSSPGTTAGGGTDWSQVSCGQYHIAAIRLQ